MRTKTIRLFRTLLLLFACTGGQAYAPAAEPLRFTNVELLPNNEITLTLSVAAGSNYRLEAATDLSAWSGLATLAAGNASSLQYTDAAAPFLNGRYYRIQQLTEPDVFTGDHLATDDGEVIIHPLFHASFVLKWKDKIIYNDPDDDSAFAATYNGLPKGNLILVSHTHSDHFSAGKIDAVRAPEAVIVAPQAVFSMLSAEQKAITVVLANGASSNLMGLTVEAVPAYNGNHPRGSGNGYVLTIGGKRLYMSGDTGNIPETRALANIDVAFLCMNQPFTMTVNEATNCVRAFRPKVLYPYHYRDQGGSTANANTFKQRLGTDPGVETRLRKWY